MVYFRNGILNTNFRFPIPRFLNSSPSFSCRDFKPHQYMKFCFESFSFNMDAINHVLWSYKENSEQLSDPDLSLVGTTTN
jgi:hypothetical protein